MEPYNRCGYCGKQFEDNEKIVMVYWASGGHERPSCNPCGKIVISGQKNDKLGLYGTFYKKKPWRIEESEFVVLSK